MLGGGGIFQCWRRVLDSSMRGASRMLSNSARLKASGCFVVELVNCVSFGIPWSRTGSRTIFSC